MHESNADQGSEPYKTLAGEGAGEHVVERSRFLSWAWPVRSLETAEAHVAAKRREHHDARHVCFGLRIGRGALGLDRSNDDGEPSRTGGFPLWQLLSGEDVIDAVIVVVRYYGGIKLGMGGLARAYREAGRLAMEDASVLERFPELTLPVTIPYASLDSVQHVLSDLSGVRTVSTDYTDQVTLTLAIHKIEEEAVRARLAALLQRAPDAL